MRAYVVGADLAAHDVVHNDHFDGKRIDGLDGRRKMRYDRIVVPSVLELRSCF